MKRKPLNKFAKRRRIALMGIIGVILLIILIILLSTTKKHKIPEKMSLMLNNQIVELQKNMYKENDVIYISKEDIMKLFDDTLYYNAAEK